MTWSIHRVEKRGALFYVIGVNGQAVGLKRFAFDLNRGLRPRLVL